MTRAVDPRFSSLRWRGNRHLDPRSDSLGRLSHLTCMQALTPIAGLVYTIISSVLRLAVRTLSPCHIINPLDSVEYRLYGARCVPWFTQTKICSKPFSFGLTLVAKRALHSPLIVWPLCRRSRRSMPHPCPSGLSGAIRARHAIPTKTHARGACSVTFTKRWGKFFIVHTGAKHSLRNVSRACREMLPVRQFLPAHSRLSWQPTRQTS